MPDPADALTEEQRKLTLPVGSIVSLRGFPERRMTVERIPAWHTEGGYVHSVHDHRFCVWFDDHGVLHEHEFHIAILVPFQTPTKAEPAFNIQRAMEQAHLVEETRQRAKDGRCPRNALCWHDTLCPGSFR